jgi:hypothetical protein
VTAEPLVTVVTPSLNQARFIRDTVASVAEQDYPHVEHLVIDGCSTDGTLEALAPLLDRITWVSEPDRGQTDALSKGFRLARGDILTWLNADDRLLPGAISRVVSAFAENPGAGLVYGSGGWIDEDGASLGEYEPPPHWGVWELVHISAFILQPAAFFTREAYEAVGRLREDLDYTMDWDLFIRIASRFPMTQVRGAPIAAMRLHGSTKTASGGLRRFAEIARVARSHADGRLPPLVALYGIETALQLVRRAVRRVRPELAPLCTATSNDALAHLQHRLCGLIASRTSAVQSDGWAGRRVAAVLPPGGPDVVIQGVVPDQVAGGRQSLTVQIAGWPLHRSIVGPGEFNLRIPHPLTHKPVSLTIEASRWFVPPRVGLGGHDTRRLAWLVRSIGWASERGPKILRLARLSDTPVDAGRRVGA